MLEYRESSKRWEPRVFISRNKNSILVQECDGEGQSYAFQKVNEQKGDIFLPKPDLYGIEDDAGKDGELRKS